MRIHLSHRAGLTTINTVTIIAGVILLGFLGWAGFQYFGGQPMSTNSSTQHNGTNRSTVPSQGRTVKGFFSLIANEWRPTKKVYAAGGVSMARYDYNLPVGETSLIATDDALPADETNTNEASNINAGSNTNQGGSTNESANTNISSDTNSSENSNANTPVENTNIGIPPNENLNQTGNTNQALNTNSASEEVIHTSVISAADWLANLPQGKAYVKVNWFCSAAFIHLLYLTGDTPKPVGDFTGDCTNPNVSVKGLFIPQILGPVSTKIEFGIVSEDPLGKQTSVSTQDKGICIVDYFKDAGHKGVYAAQFTCDDGLGIQRTVVSNVNGVYQRVPADTTNTAVQPNSDGSVPPDDIQFTVYVFPENWSSPTDPLLFLNDKDFSSDEDGDGLIFREEVQKGMNPNNWDTDFDGLGDFEEVRKYSTDPTKRDTDGDGFTDMNEINNGYNPLGPGKATQEQLSKWAATPNQAGKPVISNVSVAVNNGHPVVSWDVSPNSDGIVNWGPTTDYGAYLSDYPFTRHHEIPISAAAGQTVHYAIRSCTPAPHAACTTTKDYTYQAP